MGRLIGGRFMGRCWGGRDIHERRLEVLSFKGMRGEGRKGM
jgi:hypothetical protein